MKIEKAKYEDLSEILELQKLCFKSEAEAYNDFSITPLNETKDDIEIDFLRKVFLKAVEDGKIIGSVRAYMRNDICYIGRLIVHPEYQNKGIGTKLMYDIEKAFGRIKRYQLFTGFKSEQNIQLYKKLGYMIYKIEEVNIDLVFVHLEKNKQELRNVV